MAMSNPPLPFLTALHQASSPVACLSNIRLFSDMSQQFIVAQANFSPDSYRQRDFADLRLECPSSIQGAVPKRQAEYLAGRYLARLVMQQSGLFSHEPPQLGSGRLRAPAWPDSVTGSISHHHSKACAVLLNKPVAADNFVGVDTELWLSEQQACEIAGSIHNAAERQILRDAGCTDAQATSLLFSAKEALFKAICPFVDEYFGFECAQLTQCGWLADTTTPYRVGWLKLQLLTDWVIAKAPQQDYHCWFSGSEVDLLTLVCSQPWLIDC